MTAGGDGVAYIERSSPAVKLPGIKVVVESTHGAGDAFVGTLAARMAIGDPFDIALSIANREAAKLVSTSSGVTTANGNRPLDFLRQTDRQA